MTGFWGKRTKSNSDARSRESDVVNKPGHGISLVLVDADAKDLPGLKAKYEALGYAVTTILITDEATRDKYCKPVGSTKPSIYGMVNQEVVARDASENLGMDAANHMVATPEQLTTLLDFLRPKALLVDSTIHTNAFPKGGVKVIETVRAMPKMKNLPIVMHTETFDSRTGKDGYARHVPHIVDEEGLNYWQTSKEGTDAGDKLRELLAAVKATNTDRSGGR